MITNIVLAIVVAIAIGLGFMLLGGVLATLNVPIAITVGGFLNHWGWTLGVLAGVWYYFKGNPFARA